MVHDATFLESRSATTRFERGIFAAAGLFCFLPAWDFLLRPGVHPFHPAMLPFWAIAAGAGWLGMQLLAGAFAGGTAVLRIDAETLTVTRTHRSPVLDRTERWRFADIAGVEVREDLTSEGPPGYDLLLRLADRDRAVPVRNFATRDDAEAAKRLVEALLETAT